MDTFESFEQDLYSLDTAHFNESAIRLFRLQYLNNAIYRQYTDYLGVDAMSVKEIEAIPFLPITFFKSHTVVGGGWTPEVVYTSSGTTGMSVSRHFVRHESFYLANAQRAFEYFYGPVSDYHVLALLPSYLERQGSSLVAMAKYFIEQSQSHHSGFYLHEMDRLVSKLGELRGDRRKVLLLSVSFALLDLAEQLGPNLSHCLVMETGGMKGRRPEITREELHQRLMASMNLNAIHSEYGMTELLSQAYSEGQGVFRCPPWMKVLLRDPEDPFDIAGKRVSGAINVIDLANIYSCAFIETQDLGRIQPGGYFEVLGRMDNSDVRGCNLLVG